MEKRRLDQQAARLCALWYRLMSTLQTVLQEETLVLPAEDECIDTVRAERTDAQLVDIVLAGDQTAFEQLYDRHKRLVASVAARYIRRPEQIEDVIQTTFAKVFVELSRFRGEHALSFPSWLSRITSNTCLDILRSQKRRPEELSDDITGVELTQFEASAGTSSEDMVINRDLAEKLLSRVAGEDRALLQMLYVQDMSMADVAERFGWTVSKTKLRAWRARHSLRRVLKRYL